MFFVFSCFFFGRALSRDFFCSFFNMFFGFCVLAGMRVLLFCFFLVSLVFLGIFFAAGRPAVLFSLFFFFCGLCLFVFLFILLRFFLTFLQSWWGVGFFVGERSVGISFVFFFVFF